MHITPNDVANITLLWDPIHIIDIPERKLIGSVARDVSAPNHLYGFSTQNRELLKTLFEKAYVGGCRQVGFIAPAFLYDTMYNTALDVSDDHGEAWDVSPVERDEYQDLVDQAQLKLLAQEAKLSEEAELLASVEEMEKQICDDMGLDTEAIVNLYGIDAQTMSEMKEMYFNTVAEIEQRQASGEVEADLSVEESGEAVIKEWHLEEGWPGAEAEETKPE